MKFVEIYRRVLGLLSQRRRAVLLLVLGNLGVAGLQFLDPLLFGHVIGLLAKTDSVPQAQLFAEGGRLVSAWVLIGACGIGVNIAVAMGSERLAHRTRLGAISRCFDRVLALPASFHAGAQSGTVMKTMISGSDSIFTLCLTFFKDNMATYVAVFVLLPLSAFLNWRLSLVLVALVCVFISVTVFVIRRTQTGQRRAEEAHSALAGRAQGRAVQRDGGAVLRPPAGRGARVRRHRRERDAPPVPGAELVGAGHRADPRVEHAGGDHHRGGRRDAASARPRQRVRHRLLHGLFHVADRPAGGRGELRQLAVHARAGIADYFTLLDTQSTVPDRTDAAELEVTHGEVAFEQVSFAYPAARRSCPT